MAVGHIGRPEPDFADFVGEMLLTSVASPGRRYGRETRTACRRIVSEVYPPPRVTAEIERCRHPHLVHGSAFDVTVMDHDGGQPLVFSIKGKRQKARKKVNEQKPFMPIWSSQCTAFSTYPMNAKIGRASCS